MTLSTPTLFILAAAVAGGIWLASRTSSPAPLAAIEVKEGVVIPPAILAAVQALGEAFLARTGRGLVITDGVRSPEAQAGLMIRNLERGDDLQKLYANKAAAAEVTAAWNEGKALGLVDAALVDHVAAVIAAQVAGGVFVSKHLDQGAVDVRSRDMTAEQRAAFLQLAGERGLKVVDETTSGTPHYHVNFA